MAIDRQEPLTAEERMSELLLRWRECRERGQAVSAEELCSDCPELADALSRQIRAVEAMEGMLALGEDTAPGPRHDAPDHATPVSGGEKGVVGRPELAAPLRLAGYELLGVMGEGGMGVVYRARQVKLNRVVAIKMLLGRHASRDQLARFRTEAEAVARLKHPNIVQVYDVGDCNGQPYLAMELVDGGTLAQRLGRTVLPARAAAELVTALAGAVQAAHERGIVHRDLKPANVLLSRKSEVGSRNGERGEAGTSDFRLPISDFEPKVADFGLAKWVVGSEVRDPDERPTQTGAILGTASYMAPEQAEGRKDMGPPADIYALGAVLYELLSGRPPFQGESTLDTLEQVRTREPLAPSRLQPKVPRDLETICLKCLHKEPGRRYASAAELERDLRRFLEGEPVQARRTPAWERALKWARRKPAGAGLLAVSILAVAVLLAVWARFTGELQAERNYARNQWEEAQKQRAAADAQREAADAQRLRAQTLLEHFLTRVDDDAILVERAKTARPREPGDVLFCVAAGYASASGAYGTDCVLEAKDRMQLAEQFAARAVKLLELGRSPGYFDEPANRRRLEQDKNLEPLRSRADFKRLVGKEWAGEK